MPERVHERVPERIPQRIPQRILWSGTLTFGLVSIPVDLLPAVRPRRTSMKIVDARGRALGREYYSEQDEHLSQDELVRGYQTDDGRMVVVTDEELESIAHELTRDMELRRFVPRDEIPPPYFDHPYFLAPSGRSQKAYQLLARAMEKTARAGVGTFVMRGRQYLVAILSEGNLLRAETLRFAGEIRSPETVGLPRHAKPARKEVKQFADAIASLTRDELDRDELSDRYAAALERLAEKKSKKGKDVVEPGGEPAYEEEGGAEVIDLMKVLKETGARRRSGAAGGRTPRPAGGAPVADRAPSGRRTPREYRRAR